MFPRRTSLLAPSPARLRPATPPCAPTRSARGMSGFWIRQVIIDIGTIIGLVSLSTLIRAVIIIIVV